MIKISGADNRIEKIRNSWYLKPSFELKILRNSFLLFSE